MSSSHTNGPRPQRWRGRDGVAVAGFGSAMLLSSAEMVSVPVGGLLAALMIALFAGLGLGVLVVGRGSSSRRHRAVLTTVAAVCLFAVALFMARLFGVGDVTAPIVRRVSETPPQVQHLRLVNLNVLHGYPLFADHEARFDALCEALRVLEPTVVTLQEAWSTNRHDNFAERLAAELGMDVTYARANGRRGLVGFEEGSAILSRLPILDARPHILKPRFAFWDRRVALSAEVAVGGGESIEFISKHLTPFDDEVNAAQTRSLASVLPADSFFVLAGDLNASSTSPSAQILGDLGLADLVPGGIDHVFVPSAATWRVAHADWTLRPSDLVALIGRSLRLSDHPGIVVDLERIPMPAVPGLEVSSSRGPGPPPPISESGVDGPKPL